MEIAKLPSQSAVPSQDYTSPQSKPRTLVGSGGTPYFVILAGNRYPAPGPPFVSRPGSIYGSDLSAPEGSDAIFDHVFVLDEHSRAFDYPQLRTEFDKFISRYADQIVADYRDAETRATPRPVSPSRVEARRAPLDPPSGEASAAFNPAFMADERRRALANRVFAPGQSLFREKLMRAYDGRCAITGCNVEAALEAAHIIHYCGPESDHVGNGLLLRLDLHARF